MSSSSGENFLLERGLLNRTSRTQRQVIGCLACRWANNAPTDTPGAYARQIGECSGLKSGTIVPILRRIEKGGAITAQYEDIDSKAAGRPLRKFYTPANTQLGAAFAESLEVPPVCGLNEKASSTTTAQPEALGNNFEQAINIIDTSSREELEFIIKYARNQIGRLDIQS